MVSVQLNFMEFEKIKIWRIFR